MTVLLVFEVELGAGEGHLGAGVPHLVHHGALGVPLVLLSFVGPKFEGLPLLDCHRFLCSLWSTDNI